MAPFIILKIIKFLKVDSVFYSLFKNIFSATPILIKNVGIVPVTYAIFTLYSSIGKGLIINKLPTLILERLHPVIIRDLIDPIAPYWDKCLTKNSPLLKNFFRLYLGFFSIGLIRPLMTITFKYSFGLIFSSLGIAFNEVLSSITLLKWISDNILSIFPIIPFLQNFLNYTAELFININNPVNKDVINKIKNNEKIQDTSSILSIIGLVIITGSTIFLLILTGDYLCPSIIRTIPGVDTILNSWYSVWNYTISWFQSTPSTPDSSPTKSPIDLPDTISRSFSDSSGSTGSSGSTAQPLTPNPSRPGTPTVWLSRTNPADPNNEPWN